MATSDPPAIREFLSKFDAAVAAGVAPAATLSELLLGRTSRVPDIRAGGDVRVRVLARAEEKLATLVAKRGAKPSRRRSRVEVSAG